MLKAMPPPTAKETWLIDFARVLTDTRPDLGGKFARVIATNAWVREKSNPAVDAAKRWLAEHQR